MPQRFRWHILESGRAVSNPDERGYDLVKETKPIAVALSAREVSDYLYEFGNPTDIVILHEREGTEVSWESLSEFLAEDSEAQKYGFPPSNVDQDSPGLENWISE